MKMTELEVVNHIQVLNQISNKSLPGIVTLAIVKNMKSLNAEYEPFATARDNVIKKYAKFGEDEKPLIMNGEYQFETQENKDSFDKELNELVSQEVEVEIRKVSDELFARCDSISPSELMALDFMTE